MTDWSGSVYRSRSPVGVRPLLLLKLVLNAYQIGIDHVADKFMEADLRFPAQLAACLAGITDQQVHLGRTD